jgi:hypothetical protein
MKALIHRHGSQALSSWCHQPVIMMNAGQLQLSLMQGVGL